MCLALGLALMVVSRPAHAQQPDYARARQAYKNAEAAFAKGEFAIAAREFGVAYEITKDPVLFYKIAEAQEKSGDCDTAVVYYGRYLHEANPDAEYQKLTKAALKRCGAGGSAKPDAGAGTSDTGSGTGDTGTGAAGSGTDSGAAAGAGTGSDTGTGTSASGGGVPFGDDDAPPPPHLDEERSRWKRTAAWVSVGLTVGLATTGAVLGLSASSRQEDLQNLIDFRSPQGDPAAFEGSIKDKYDNLVDEGKRLDSMSRIAFVAAGGTAIVATVFFILDAKAPSDDGETALRGHHVTPIIGAGQLGFGVGWEF